MTLKLWQIHGWTNTQVPASVQFPWARRQYDGPQEWTHGTAMTSTAEDLRRAAEIIGRRLSPKDIRTVLKEIDRASRGNKSVERIVAEAENPGRLLRPRIEEHQLAAFLVDVAGQDMLTNRTLRELLALRATESELDRLHDFPGGSRARGTTQASIARCVAGRNWHPGKRWARHFVSVLGLPEALAGCTGSPGGPNFEDVQPHVKLDPLTDFQEDLRSQVVDLLLDRPGQNRAILTLPTGAGKTRTTVEALTDWWLSDRRTGSILWIAQSDELCEQAVQAFREVWIDRGDQGVRHPLRLYRLWGTRKTVPEDPGVIVSTIDKLRHTLMGGENTDVRDTLLGPSFVGVLVIDEAHRAEAKSYREVLDSMGVAFTPSAVSPVPVLGLTATPLRSQHEETLRLARRFYGRLLRPRNLPEDPGSMLIELRNRGVLSRPTHQFLPPASRHPIRLTHAQEEYVAEWKDLPSDLLAELGETTDRNRQILQAITRLDPEWPVLFFGCSVQHAEAVAVLLRRRGHKAAAVTAETRDAARRHLVEAFRHGEIQVLCNYGVLTTGFDAPRVRAVVVGRPTASRVLYDQMIGRGMRGPKFGGTEECLVIDVDDNVVHLNGDRLMTAAQQYQEYWTSQQTSPAGA
jgi:DNA repair protein RadD